MCIRDRSSAGVYWWYASWSGDANNQSAAASCGTGMSQTIVAQLQLSSCSLGTGGLSINCPTTGTATVNLRRANQGGGSWSASATLTDSLGNPIVNTTGGAISVAVTSTTPGAAITYSSGTSLTIPSGSAQSSNSFTYSNGGVASGKGGDTVTATSTGSAPAVANVSW